MKPFDVPADGYYSPQQLSTRLFQLDLQVANLAALVRSLYADVKGDHKHVEEIDAILVDLQSQIRACAAQHEKKTDDIQGVPV